MTEKIKTTRDGFGRGLVEAAQKNQLIVGLNADLTDSTRMSAFAQQFPDRFVQVGVAEQNLAGVAAGFALAGKIPFAASYACFQPANCWGVIRTSIAYSNLNVKLVGGHAGLATGEDGATHQSLEDIALMRVLPNMTVIVPADGEEARKATLAAATHQGPVYLRTSKLETGVLTTPETPFDIGRAVLLRPGHTLTLVACGVMVARALQASARLEELGMSAAVLNMHTIKPLDIRALAMALERSPYLITLEDHQAAGGLGSAVAEYLSQQRKEFRLKIMAVKDTFGQSGQGNQLLDYYGLGVEQIIHTSQRVCAFNNCRSDSLNMLGLK
ncbi:MAG: transketolase [Candidatus Pacebacteria bacterium CG10_big_fil_rev_8_21_14_0_10_44_11]|nr:MAG: transketolase [Candidatus Pacebacteria bacterium CG10_big_fil_rev_8_21_14_0_10_44_11]